MGRLALRAAWSSTEFDIVHINEIAGDAAAAAHLLQFDSMHGIWDRKITASPTSRLRKTRVMRFVRSR